MERFLSDKFLDELPDDRDLAIKRICEKFFELNKERQANVQYYEEYLEAYSILKAFSDSKKYNITPKDLSNSPTDNMNNIISLFHTEYDKIIIALNATYFNNQYMKHSGRFASISTYSFSDDDYKRIQELINEMRDIIAQSDIIEDKHKRRLLERLERMQKELHKHTSDMDRFWGFIGEAGLVIGKFGNDIKPFIDRVRELSSIILKVVAIKEGLLDNQMPILPQFPKIEDNKDNDTISV